MVEKTCGGCTHYLAAVVGETEKACGDYLIPLSDIRIGDLALAALDTEATKQ